MNEKQLSDRIGNVNDKLVQQAEQTPNYGREHRKRSIRQLVAIAATIALMVCSFTVGALAFAKETIVEVPVEQEKIVLDKIGLTILLPDEWADKYGVERNKDGTGCGVYVKSIHDGDGAMAGLGYLFWVGKAASDQQPLTPDELYEWSPTPCIYLFSTSDTTYILEKHSDVQYDPYDPAQKELYMTMSRQIQDISFQIEHPAMIDI